MSKWDDYKKSLKETGGKVKKVNYGNTMQNAGVSSDTPSSLYGLSTLPKAGKVLPKAETNKTFVGPVQWNKNDYITTLPKAGEVLPKADDKWSGLERASRIGNIEVSDSIKNRGDNIVKGVASSFAASPLLLGSAAVQSEKDWFNKVKTQGMEKALTDYAYNLDNPDYNFGSQPVSKNSIGYRAYQKSQDYYDKALEGLSPKQQTAGRFGISALELLATAPTAAINPAAPLVLQSVKSAADKAYNLTNEGKSATEALGRGLVKSSIDYAARQIGYNDFFNLAKNGTEQELMAALNSIGADTKNAIIFGLKDIGYKYFQPTTLGNITWDAVRSALTGAARTIAENADDRTYDKDKKVNWTEAAQNAAVDALYSVVTNGVGRLGSYAFLDRNVNRANSGGSQLPSVYNGGAMNNMLPYAGGPALVSNGNNYMPIANEADIAMPKAETPMSVQSSANNSTANDVRNVPNLQIANSSEISDYIDKSLRNENTNMFMKIGEVSDKLKNDLSKIGLKANKFVHALRDNDIRHIDKSHGLKSNDKYKVGKEDYLLLNDIFNNYDTLYQGYKTKSGNMTIAYEKIYNNKIYVVEEVYEDGVLSVKQILKTGTDSRPSFLKKMQKINDTTNANVASSMTRSTDYINSPPGEHVQDVSPIIDNSIPENPGKINTNPSTNIETKIFDGSGEGDFDLSNTLTDTDVNAYNFIKKTADKKNTDVSKIYEVYKKARENLFNKTVNEIFEGYKKYKPQGTTLINTTENMGGGTVERMQRVSNNEKWYSEAYKEYGLKPNQLQLKQFIEKKVEADIRNGGGEYIDAETALTFQKYDSLLDGFDKVTENGTMNVSDIRKNADGYYEVDYVAPGSINDNTSTAPMMMNNFKGYSLSKRIYTDSEQAIIDKYENRLKKQKEKRELSKLGDEVLKTARRIQKEYKHMPPDMKEKAYSILYNIDTKAKGISKRSIEKANELKSYVENMQAIDPNFVVSKDIQSKIDRLNKDKRISKMTFAELQDLSDTLSGLEHEFRNRNKMLGDAKKREVSALAAQAKKEISSVKPKKNGFVHRIYNVEALNPSTIFNMLSNFDSDGGMNVIKNELLEGQRRQVKFVKDSTVLFDDFLSNKEYAKELATWSGKKAKLIDTGFKDESGKPIYMTAGERIDIYLHSLNDNNRATLMNGGYTFMNKESLAKGDTKNIYRNMHPVRFSSADLTRIVSSMTPAEKAFAEVAFKYFNDVSPKAINETSMRNDGYEKATEKNYYPKSVDKDSIVTEFALEDENGNINNPGYLQERTGTTAVPLKGRNAVEVVLKSINDVSRYYGYATAVRDFSMVWNSKGGGDTALKKVIANVYGSDMVDYINKFVKDINSAGSDRYFIDNLAGKLMGNYASAVLNFNPKVSLQQTASLVTAAPEVGYGNIVKALFTDRDIKKQIIKEIDSRSGYRWDRAFRGNSTAELSALTKDKGFKAVGDGILQKAKDTVNPTKWIRNMDLWATDQIAYAAYHKAVADGKHEVGTDAFWNDVADNYSRTLENTQPIYNIMERTGIARSNSTIAKAINMFATQRNQNYNMAYNAVGEYRSAVKSGKNAKEAKAKLGKTATALFISNAVVTLITTLAQAVTDDDKLRDDGGNITTESVLRYYADAFLSSAAGNIIGGSQLYNAAEAALNNTSFWAGSEPTLDMINDITDSAITLYKSVGSYIAAVKESVDNNMMPGFEMEATAKAMKAMHDTVVSLAKALGIPFGNAEKYIVGVTGIFCPALEARYKSLYTGTGNSAVGNASARTKDSYVEMSLKDRISDDISDNTVSRITDLYSETDNKSSVLPRAEAPNKISKEATQSRKAINYELTAKDKKTYMDKYKSVLDKEICELVDSGYYDSLSTDEQYTVLKYLYSYADEQAKKSVVKQYEISDTYNKKNITISDYKELINKKREQEKKKKK